MKLVSEFIFHKIVRTSYTPPVAGDDFFRYYVNAAIDPICNIEVSVSTSAKKRVIFSSPGFFFTSEHHKFPSKSISFVFELANVSTFFIEFSPVKDVVLWAVRK